MSRDDDDYYRDEGEHNGGGNPLWYGFLLVLVATPLTIVATLFTRWLHVSQRIKIKHIFLYGLLPLTVISLIFFDAVFNRFVTSWTNVFPQMLSGDIEPFQGVLTMLVQQANLSILVGGYVGLIYAYLAMKDNPEWDTIEWRRSPRTLLQRKRNMKKAALADYAPHPGMIKDPEKDDGIMVGVTRDEGEIVIQSWLKTRTHTLISGAPGTGKTETLKNRIRDAARKGEGVVLVDFKASPELAQIAHDLAARYGRTFQHFTMYGDNESYSGPSPNGAAHYDSIGRGNSTRRKDLVLGMREWTEEHYKRKVAVYLELIFKTMIMNPNPNISSMDDISNLLDPRHLQERAAHGFAGKAEFQHVMHSIDRLNDTHASRKELETLENIRTLMDEMRHSVAGRFLRKNLKNPELNIDLLETARKGRIVVFSLDANEYEDMARNVANLVVQDMKTITNQLRALTQEVGEYNPMQFIFDEFASMKSDSIISLMNKSRDAKIGVTLSVQSINDLKAVSDSFASVCLSNCGTYILHRENDPFAAKTLAALSGTRRGLSVTRNYSRGSTEDQSTNVKEQEEFAISVSDIQNQGPGQAIYIDANEMVTAKDGSKTRTVLKIQEVMEDPSVANNMPPQPVDEESDGEAYLRYINRENREETINTAQLATDLGLQIGAPMEEQHGTNDAPAFRVPASPPRNLPIRGVDSKNGFPARTPVNYFPDDDSPQDINYGRTDPGPVDYEKLERALTPKNRAQVRRELGVRPDGKPFPPPPPTPAGGKGETPLPPLPKKTLPPLPPPRKPLPGKPAPKKPGSIKDEYDF